MENLRLNRFFVMTADGNAVSLDELNKFLNLWKQTCVGTINFGKAYEKSKHIMMMQKCAYEAYGKNSSKSVPPNQAVAIFANDRVVGQD